MQYQAIEKTLSISRFSTYRSAVLACKGEDCSASALALYEYNANLSSALLFTLHIYEVTLRNAISDAIASRYGNDWPISTVFQNSLNYRNKQGLIAAIGNDYRGLGKVLPEIKLSWYEEMLTRRHDGRIWENCINDIFPNVENLTVSQIRSYLKSACFSIRKIRNRIAHHEPIFNQNSLPDILPYIEESVGMRCSETKAWLKSTQKVRHLLLNPVL